MGINIGSVIGYIVCGYLMEYQGWHWAFGAAAVGMALGLIQYKKTLNKLELLKNEAKADEIPALPLGVLIAHTQGGIGYIIQQSLQNLLSKKGLEKEVVTFVSQVKVDPNDPKLKNLTNLIKS